MVAEDIQFCGVPCLYHHLQGKNKLLIPPVKGEDYEKLFQNELL